MGICTATSIRRDPLTITRTPTLDKLPMGDNFPCVSPASRSIPTRVVAQKSGSPEEEGWRRTGPGEGGGEGPQRPYGIAPMRFALFQNSDRKKGKPSGKKTGKNFQNFKTSGKNKYWGGGKSLILIRGEKPEKESVDNATR